MLAPVLGFPLPGPAFLLVAAFVERRNRPEGTWTAGALAPAVGGVLLLLVEAERIGPLGP
ncbi:hypothetical protein [Streptomyces sp. NPDC059564]|uniref:hypothetical protein n=1 Tax=Streptomyces sp. NPDC059564 TaxID=3346865 RepID=UPI0036BA1FE4